MSASSLSVTQAIESYTAALRAAGVRSVFQEWSSFEPASEGELDELVSEVGTPLPAELIEWLQGVTHELPFVGNYSGLRASRVRERIEGKRTIDFSRQFENITSWADGRFDDGRLARTYWQPQWIPLAADGCGNEYCYDLAPGPSGRVGQILAMEFQDGQGPYLAAWDSLGSMLDDHLARLERGAYTLDDEGVIEFAFE